MFLWPSQIEPNSNILAFFILNMPIYCVYYYRVALSDILPVLCCIRSTMLSSSALVPSFCILTLQSSTPHIKHSHRHSHKQTLTARSTQPTLPNRSTHRWMSPMWTTMATQRAGGCLQPGSEKRHCIGYPGQGKH